MRARKTDLDTSHEAGERVTNISETKRYLLKVLARPRTHAEMIEAYRNMKFAPPAEDSGLRSRCAELVDDGLVEIAGETRTRSGRRAYIWRATV